MTTAHCDAQMHRLGVLRGMPADTFEYFAALQDVPDERFTKAVSHALKTRMWFPTPAELRADCDAVATTVVYEPDPRINDVSDVSGRKVFLANPFGGKGITVTLGRDWRFDCERCEDSGWAQHTCPEQYCGHRRRDHDPHTWVDACACVGWNPTILRRKAAAAKFAQPPEKVGT